MCSSDLTRAAALKERATPAQAAAIDAACRRLLEPREMGTLFRVQALSHPALAAPAGLSEGLAA